MSPEVAQASDVAGERLVRSVPAAPSQPLPNPVVPSRNANIHAKPRVSFVESFADGPHPGVSEVSVAGMVQPSRQSGRDHQLIANVQQATHTQPSTNAHVQPLRDSFTLSPYAYAIHPADDHKYGSPAQELFLVDNSYLRATSHGLGYRLSKNLCDRESVDYYVAWGSTVSGTYVGDGWVQVGSGRFMPMTVDGVPVLIRQPTEQVSPRGMLPLSHQGAFPFSAHSLSAASSRVGSPTRVGSPRGTTTSFVGACWPPSNRALSSSSPSMLTLPPGGCSTRAFPSDFGSGVFAASPPYPSWTHDGRHDSGCAHGRPAQASNYDALEYHGRNSYGAYPGSGGCGAYCDHGGNRNYGSYGSRSDISYAQPLRVNGIHGCGGCAGYVEGFQAGSRMGAAAGYGYSNGYPVQPSSYGYHPTMQHEADSERPGKWVSGPHGRRWTPKKSRPICR